MNEISNQASEMLQHFKDVIYNVHGGGIEFEKEEHYPYHDGVVDLHYEADESKFIISIKYENLHSIKEDNFHNLKLFYKTDTIAEEMTLGKLLYIMHS